MAVALIMSWRGRGRGRAPRVEPAMLVRLVLLLLLLPLLRWWGSDSPAGLEWRWLLLAEMLW